ncbi:putative fasciclin-like arabinogalactan protein 20 [Cucurbita pepo subsp. pepo]|uniref:putative fasciclin-like arabinogalactan protein 20 n=1 Tax=Cucurbita pepo subsp. pepo TaxID=3664 RepID=UPI000C9D48EF|nr:putative fasciclin-like arabinogalactan protein 20 [Cucurbita pepo subsp. pepo]
MISSSPIYDDGSLVVFGTEKFFDLKFQVFPVIRNLSAGFRCGPMTEKNSFGEAIETLRSNGYSSMALFLESQILRFSNGQSMMTVFAPSDDTLAARIDDFTDYPSLYCRILWNDLVDLEKGTKLSTYSKGSAISVAKSNGILMINGVAVIYPNMYVNDWLVAHDLLDVTSVAERLSAKESGSEMRNITHGKALDHW